MSIHKVAISVNTTDTLVQKRALDNIERIKEYFGAETIIEIVSYGPGLVLLTLNSQYQQEIKHALSQKNGLAFSACANTMKKIEEKTGKKPVLIDGVSIVAGGVVRLIELQEQGYAYISP